MNILYISILEAIYLIYMFHFFETSVDFSVGESPTAMFFKHAKGNEKTLRICPFGRYAIIIFILILIGRNFCHLSNYFIKASIAIALILSLMNLNALIYLIPVLLTEFLFSGTFF